MRAKAVVILGLAACGSTEQASIDARSDAAGCIADDLLVGTWRVDSVDAGPAMPRELVLDEDRSYTSDSGSGTWVATAGKLLLDIYDVPVRSYEWLYSVDAAQLVLGPWARADDGTALEGSQWKRRMVQNNATGGSAYQQHEWSLALMPAGNATWRYTSFGFTRAMQTGTWVSDAAGFVLTLPDRSEVFTIVGDQALSSGSTYMRVCP